MHGAVYTKKESHSLFNEQDSLIKRQLPTLPLLRSTIGVIRLNFSVRNGKRWNPDAIATLIFLISFLSDFYLSDSIKINTM